MHTISKWSEWHSLFIRSLSSFFASVGQGFKEVLINDLCYNILILIEEEKTFECLFNELLPCFSSEISKDKEQTYKLILTEVEYLLYHGVICIN